MSFQDLEAGNVRGAPLGRRNGRAPASAGAGASQAVASGVFQINTAVATFQRLVNTLGTPKDTPDLRDRMCVRSTYPLSLPASANLSAASRFRSRLESYRIPADAVSRGSVTAGFGFICGIIGGRILPPRF